MASTLEIISIGAVVPFLAALTSPETVYKHYLAQPLINMLNITQPSQLVLPLTVIFIVATLVSAAVRLLLLYVSTRFSYATGSDLSIDIYRRTLYQDYLIHMSRNSSEIISSIMTKTNLVIGHIVMPLLTIISSVVTMLGIIGVASMVNAKVALIAFVFLGSIYWTIYFFTKKALRKNSQLIADKSTQMVQFLQEGLGGIRDVLIDGTQEFYCALYRKADLLLRRASGNNLFIGSSPRYLLEALGMILIAVLAYSLTLQEGGIMQAIPVLGALAVGAQRLLPALQQAYSSYSTIKGSKSSFMDVLDLLDQPLPLSASQNSINALPFSHDISFKDVSFRYSENSRWILKNVSLRFKKGEIIGFVGITGSGKSTFLDILMGLLTPTSGQLLVDGVAITVENRRAWQEYLSHVPQNIYLADSTILENIAFGVELEKISELKVSQVAQWANISEVIDNLQNKYKSLVGEQGSKLSGGQRQRIGIARALYKGSDVLVLDEATSALDNQTEHEIMRQISELKESKTIFIIAHRLTTLKQCDSIFRVHSDGTLEKVNYNQI